MNSQRINALLWMSSAVLALGAIGAIIVGIAMPLDNQSAETGPAPSPGAAVVVDPIERYEVVWSRPLHNLGDQVAPATDSHSAAADSATTPFTLVGTVGRSLALLRMNDGTVEVRGVGEKLGDAEILSVEPSRVEIRLNGQTIILVKPKSADELLTRIY